MSLLNVTVLPGKSAPLRARQWFMIVLDLQSQCSHKIKIMQKVLKIFHLFIVRQWQNWQNFIKQNNWSSYIIWFYHGFWPVSCYNLIRSLPKQYSLFQLIINFNIYIMLLVSSVVVLIASIYFLIFSKLLWSVRGCEKFKYPETLIIELRRSSH